MVGCIKDVTCEHNNLIPFDVYLQLYDGSSDCMSEESWTQLQFILKLRGHS